MSPSTLSATSSTSTSGNRYSAEFSARRVVTAGICWLGILGSGCGAATPPSQPALTEPAAPQTVATLKDGTVQSADGATIHFVYAGDGNSEKTTLFFIHGWSGSTAYWEHQLTAFAPGYPVVALDLAGHGASSKERRAFNAQTFADDVVAVAQQLHLRRVVLFGHSMSGNVMLEAAPKLKGVVVGLVAVDTLNNVEERATPEQAQEFFEPAHQDFPKWARHFLATMLPEGTDPALVERVVGGAAKQDAAVLIPALQWLFTHDAAAAIERVEVPIAAINSAKHPTELAINRRHAKSFELYTLQHVGHWPMLERPHEFNQLAKQILASWKL